MELDYSEDGSVKVSMIKYTGKILISFPENIIGISVSPSVEHLFKVRDDKDTKYLPEEQAQSFHHTTAQLLFICSRSRRNIETTVAFLTTRVRQTDEDDWGKLKMVLVYLNSTRHMKLNLAVDNMYLIRWWVYASYNVH